MCRFFKRTGLYLILLFSFLVISIIAVDIALSNDAHIYPAVQVGGQAIGGLTVDAAQAVLAAAVPALPASLCITVEGADGKQWRVNPSDIDLAFDSAATARKAYQQPRQGQILQRFFSLHKIHTIQPVLCFDEAKLAAIIEKIAQEVYIAAKSAAIRHEADELMIVPAQAGRELAADSLQAVKDAIQQLQPDVYLAVRTIAPAIVAADLQQINTVLAEYRTKFDPTETARVENIQLAAKSLDQILLPPGQILSFNERVGPRTEQRGYRKAPAYVNEEQLIDDWGGGICQISSTLYNAALLADLTIIERAPHFRPPGYVPLGLDATVDFASKLDFKIENSLPDAIYISVETDVSELIVKILGKADVNQPTIRIITTELTVIEPQTEYIQDDHLAAGVQITDQAGQTGFQVSTVRVRSRNGQEISREPLADDVYNPIDRIIRIGAKATGKVK